MLCSVLIPSRTRSAYLIGAVASCLGKATDPGRIEVLIRLDDDDVDSQEEMVKYLKSIPWAVRILTGPRGRGYDDLDLMYNQLAADAKGEWLFQFNDDMRIESNGWDECLRKVKIPAPANNKVCLINPYDLGDRPTTVSPIVRTAGIHALGHFSLNAYCDAWVGQVYGELKCSFDCPQIKVRHMRDLMNDEVVESQRRGTAWEVFQHPNQKAARAADVETLRGLLGRTGSSD